MLHSLGENICEYMLTSINGENGQLMSTLVRKFLLGANYIWRCKTLRQARDKEEVDPVDQPSAPRTPTQTAPFPRIKRARTDCLSPRTSRALQRARSLWERNSEAVSSPATPRERRRSSLFIDQSPNGIQDAIHIASTEHHSSYDAASRSSPIVDELSLDSEAVAAASHNAPDELAILSPLVDGRLVDRARQK